MEKEFNLSDKKECIAIFGNQLLVYPEKDVKEFIKRLRDTFREDWVKEQGTFTLTFIEQQIDKLAGKELI